jgi:hypothetical protein
MVPVGGIWENKNSRENVKDCAKNSGKTKNKNWEILKMVHKDFFKTANPV